MQRLLDLELDDVRALFEANLFAQLSLVQRVLPGMLERGDGLVFNMTSKAGLADPPAPAGHGGWGFAYAASKAAFHRMVGVLAVEHADSGVSFVNVEPGFVMTEAMKLNDPDGEISKRLRGAPPSVPAAVIAHLAEPGNAREHDGNTVLAQRLCAKLELHEDWR